MNYFELFELPVSFIVDQNRLSSKYDGLKNNYNPASLWYNGNAPQPVPESVIDKGFETLKDPDSALQYVLEVKGLIQHGEKYELPVDFKMEVAGLNENLSATDILNIKEAEAKVFQLQKNLYTQ